MRSSGVRNVVRSLLAVCVGVVSVLVFARVASGASSGLNQHNSSLVGDYDIFTSRSPSGTLTLNSDGTFTRSNGDSGKWLVWKKNVVLNVFSSTVGNMACIYLGTAEKTGIGSRDDPGPTNCHETRKTWYAVRTTGGVPRAEPSAATPNATSGAAPSSTGKKSRRAHGEAAGVIGTYNQTIKFEPVTTLIIKGNGLDDQFTSGNLEVGYWVEHDGAIAFAVVDSQSGSLAGCIFVGLVMTQRIDSAHSPGLLNCNGSRFGWYASRTTR